MWEESTWWRKEDTEPVVTRTHTPFNHPPRDFQRPVQSKPFTRTFPRTTRYPRPPIRRYPYKKRFFHKSIKKTNFRPRATLKHKPFKTQVRSLDNLEVKEKRTLSFQKQTTHHKKAFLAQLYSKQKRLVEQCVFSGLLESEEDFSRGSFTKACQKVEVQSLQKIEALAVIDKKIEEISHIVHKKKTVVFGKRDVNIFFRFFRYFSHFFS